MNEAKSVQGYFSKIAVVPISVPYVWSEVGPVLVEAVVPEFLSQLKSAVGSLVKSQISFDSKSHSPEIAME